MPLTQERKGRIALAYLEVKLLKEGIRLNPQDTRSEIGVLVKQLNDRHQGLDVSFDEALELYQEMVQLVSAETFKPRFRVTTSKDPL